MEEALTEGCKEVEKPHSRRSLPMVGDLILPPNLWLALPLVLRAYVLNVL